MDKRESTLYFILFFLIFIFSAFREGIGTDYYSYEMLFLNSETSYSEIGFVTLNKVLHFFSSDSRIFFIVSSLIILIPFAISIYSNSLSPIYSLLLFIALYYFHSLNLVRQFMVIAIFQLYGVNYIIEKKLFLYILLVIILTSIHFSAIILIPFYFIVRKKYHFFLYFGTWLFSLTFLFNKYKLLDLIYNNFSNVSEKIAYNTKIVTYYNTLGNILVEEKTYYRLILFNLFFLVFLSFKDKLLVYDKRYVIWFNLYFISILFRNVFNNYAALYRLQYYFEISFIFLLPILFKYFDYRIIKYSVLLFFIVYAYFRFIVNHEAGIYI